jgi:hypothetical protein
MVSSAIWKSIHSWVWLQITLARPWDLCNFASLWKTHSRACFIQISLETILLPIQIALSITTLLVSVCIIQLSYLYMLDHQLKPAKNFHPGQVGFYSTWLNSHLAQGEISPGRACNLFFIYCMNTNWILTNGMQISFSEFPG